MNVKMVAVQGKIGANVETQNRG